MTEQGQDVGQPGGAGPRTGVPAGPDPALPAIVAAAWGLRGRPAKGPRPGLSLERIVAAAVRVADTEGLAAVSMSRVATELGTAPMSLYRYVAAKDELLALMVDAAYGPAPAGPPSAAGPQERTGPPGGTGWRAGLSRWAWAMRARIQVHPWVLRIPIGGLPSLPNEVGWFEEGLRCLGDTGLEENEKASAILLVSGYVRNTAMIDADIEAAVRASGRTPDEWMSSYARMVTQLADPQRFPALTKFIAAGVFDRADPPDTEFAFGLDRVLDGLAALIRTRP
jgi:AcrR family transcriptional regulator